MPSAELPLLHTASLPGIARKQATTQRSTTNYPLRNVSVIPFRHQEEIDADSECKQA